MTSALSLSHFLSHLSHLCPTSVPLTEIPFHGVITSSNRSVPLDPLVPTTYYILISLFRNFFRPSNFCIRWWWVKWDSGTEPSNLHKYWFLWIFRSGTVSGTVDKKVGHLPTYYIGRLILSGLMQSYAVRCVV